MSRMAEEEIDDDIQAQTSAFGVLLLFQSEIEVKQEVKHQKRKRPSPPTSLAFPSQL
jgi:hypothetical protein